MIQLTVKRMMSQYSLLKGNRTLDKISKINEVHLENLEELEVKTQKEDVRKVQKGGNQVMIGQKRSNCLKQPAVFQVQHFLIYLIQVFRF